VKTQGEDHVKMKHRLELPQAKEYLGVAQMDEVRKCLSLTGFRESTDLGFGFIAFRNTWNNTFLLF
jgi:hypothetical protein